MKDNTKTIRLTPEKWAAIATPGVMAGWTLQMVNPDGYVRYMKKVGAYELRVQEMYDPTQCSWRVSTDSGFLDEGIASALDTAMQAAENSWQKHSVSAETYTVRRITDKSKRLYTPPPAGITMPRDRDADRLTESIAALPAGLTAEFTLSINARPPTFYITKHNTPATHWALFALHIDPIYGESQPRQMPRNARKWLGRSPWATALMIAHQVPAWCISAYPNPCNLPVTNLVSDTAGLIATIDPILYGVMVAGSHWAFVPLAAWRL